MHELNDSEAGLVAGGIDLGGGGSGSFGYGTVPGFFAGGPQPQGPNYTHSFGNGWSLTAGSTTDGSASGIGVRFVWK